MNISLYRQFFIAGFFGVMKLSRIQLFFIIISRTRLAFIMKNSCIGEMFIAPRQRRLTSKKKIMRNCQYQEIFIAKNKQKKEK